MTSTKHSHEACCAHGQHDHQSQESRPAPAVGTGARRSRLYIAGMDCPTEEALLRQALQPLPGVQALHFDLLGRVLSVDHALDDEAPLLRAVAATGMQAQALHDVTAAPPAPGPAVP
ncbi:MAG TPA: cation transporter, partial [Roseateles sp.]|nr:cation transporter [Roseateles sp.]